MSLRTLGQWLSGYQRPFPVVVMRTAAWTVTPNGDRLAADATQQIKDAAVAIKRRFGSEVRFQTYFLASVIAARYKSTAYEVNSLLRPQVAGEGEPLSFYRPVDTFLANVDTQAIPVIVASVYDVRRLLRSAGLSVDVLFAVPHFLAVQVAKNNHTLPYIKVSTDRRSS